MKTTLTYDNDSLLITAELCLERGIDKENFKIGSILLNGVTIDDIYTKKVPINIPIELLMWTYFNLPLTNSDKKKVLELAKIVDSTAFYDSYNITNCKLISESKFCKNSQDIQNSSHINNSLSVIGSTEVENSQYICNSKDIVSSACVFFSEKVGGSNYIINSQNIYGSRLVINGKDIDNSYYVLNTERSSNLILCADIYNSKNKILCSMMNNNDDPMICNKVVSQIKFDNLRDFLIEELTKITPKITANRGTKESFKNHVINHTPALYVDKTIFFETFKNLDFWDKICRALDLTEEDKKLIYNFTLCPEVVLAKN